MQTAERQNALNVINENGIVDENEILLGMKAGVMNFTDPEYVTYFKLVKDLVPYYNVGFNSASWEFESLFNEGQAAMTLNGSWYPNQHMINGDSVNYGVAMIPYVDDAIYSGSRNERVKYMVSPPEGDIVVTQKAADEGRADAAVGFLQFVSNAKGGGKTWVDKTMFLPVIKDVEMPEVMKRLKILSVNADDIFREQNAAYGCRGTYCIQGNLLKYLENDQTAEEFAAQVQELYSQYLDDVIAMNSVDINSYIDKIK